MEAEFGTIAGLRARHVLNQQTPPSPIPQMVQRGGRRHTLANLR